ncbi:MAG: hypothetical protein ABW130_07630 [Candidatus Thiodiazotropha lotti]
MALDIKLLRRDFATSHVYTQEVSQVAASECRHNWLDGPLGNNPFSLHFQASGKLILNN